MKAVLIAGAVAEITADAIVVETTATADEADANFQTSLNLWAEANL